MITLALVLTALLFCMVIGLPLGIWLARSPRAAKIIRPLLDAMQTTPAFVYLVPIVMLFGIGNAGRGGDHYLRPAADCSSDHPRD
jgi:glycine betaine/proline transport system permease protein